MNRPKRIAAQGWTAIKPFLRNILKRRRRNSADPSGALPADPNPALTAAIPGAVAGRIRVSFHPSEPGAGASRPPPEDFRHRHVWVRGPHYQGMEDNDIRGFLDGRCVHPWNQPGQIHVRVGRLRRGPNLGEWEIFRILQRWAGLGLPADARVSEARLVLTVERGVDPAHGVDREMDVFLYNVLRDWNPGGGGKKGNNSSPAAAGEVWWNETGHGESQWGLPGAGFASDTHPEADTPAMPLAVARYRPGVGIVSFSSRRLDAYVESRARTGAPLLFLVKLSDYLEDAAGSVMSFYSANQGDDENTARRPRLEVEWVPGPSAQWQEEEILLEHARTLVLPQLEVVGPGTLALSFEREEVGEMPVLQVRPRDGDRESRWSPFPFPGRWETSSPQVRIQALRNPILMGSPFTARFRDTWVRTGPPDEQEVPWIFEAPSGRRHRVFARFQGDFTWRVEFFPDEPGRWTYQWSQQFLTTTFHSAPANFDVVPGDRKNALRALDALEERARSSTQHPGRERMLAFSTALNRIVRGLMRTQTPEDFRLDVEDPGEIGRRLDQARHSLGGKPLPRESRLELVDRGKLD